jgi:hypothetical protein
VRAIFNHLRTFLCNIRNQNVLYIATISFPGDNQMGSTISTVAP